MMVVSLWTAIPFSKLGLYFQEPRRVQSGGLKRLVENHFVGTGATLAVVTFPFASTTT